MEYSLRFENSIMVFNSTRYLPNYANYSRNFAPNFLQHFPRAGIMLTTNRQQENLFLNEQSQRVPLVARCSFRLSVKVKPGPKEKYK